MTHPALKKSVVFLEMIKFEHSVFALPFAYLGLILAVRGLPTSGVFLWVTVAMVSFRTMAMGANRLIDQAIDAANPRTSARALPAGLLSRPFTWAATLTAMAVFVLSAAVLGPPCLQLAVIPLALAWAYPWIKRFAWFSHLVLGMILGIAPYGAWLAGGGPFSWAPGLFTAGVVAWVTGFDIIYALQDLEFDRRAGLHSFPVRFGEASSIRVTRVLHAVTLACWFFAGRLTGLGTVFNVGLALAAVFLFREHRLISRYGIGKMNEAFFSMNAVVSLTVFLAAAADLAWGGGA